MLSNRETQLAQDYITETLSNFIGEPATDDNLRKMGNHIDDRLQRLGLSVNVRQGRDPGTVEVDLLVPTMKAKFPESIRVNIRDGNRETVEEIGRFICNIGGM